MIALKHICNPKIARFHTHILNESGSPLCGAAQWHVHGGIGVATCRTCLRIGLKQANALEYLPGVLERAIRRARNRFQVKV